MPTPQEFFHGLFEDSGIDEATRNAIIANPKVASRVANYVQRKEYEDLERRAADIELELNGNGTDAKPGTKAYAKWYADNYEKIVASQRAAADLQKSVALYEERYGKLDGTGNPPAKPAGGTAVDEKALADMVQKVVAENFAPQWSSLIKFGGQMV